MLRSAEETAILLAVILKRSNQNRARISTKTIRLISKRKRIQQAFIEDVTDALWEYGWVLIDLTNGGYGAEKTKILESAKPVTAKKWLEEGFRKALKTDESIDFESLEREVLEDDNDATDGGDW